MESIFYHEENKNDYVVLFEDLQFHFDDEEELRMNAIRFSIYNQMRILQFQYYPSYMKKSHSLQLPKKILITDL